MASEWAKIINATIKDFVRREADYFVQRGVFLQMPYEKLPSKYRQWLGNLTGKEFWQWMFRCDDHLVFAKMMDFRRLAEDEARHAYRCWWV
jgi:hypothetical protein